jgi:hypothetical protein
VLEPTADGFRNYLRDGQKLSPETRLLDLANLLTLTAPEMTVLIGGMRALNANFGQSQHGIFTDRPETLTNDFFLSGDSRRRARWIGWPAARGDGRAARRYGLYQPRRRERQCDLVRVRGAMGDLTRAAWAQPVEVQTIAAYLVAGLSGNLGDGGIGPLVHDVVDPAAAGAHGVRVRGGQVGVIAIRPVTKLELEHLASGLQGVECLVDGGGAHHRIVFGHSLEELLRAGVLAALHQRA